MKTSRTKRFLQSPTANLVATYVIIIMVLSIGFSLVFYHTSSHELGRQIPPNSFFNQYKNAINSQNSQATNQQPPPRINDFFQSRIDEGRSDLLRRLILLNAAALVIGSGVSYVLARRSLQPIEQAMEAQAQFVSDASHELRTPLTAIQTSNEVALRKPKLNLVDAKKIIAQNNEDVVKLKALSDGLLNLAQHQKNVVLLASTDISEVVSTAMNQVVQQAMVRDIAVYDDTQSILALADKASLAQALVILLDNAVKYSHNHGNVYVKTDVKGKSAYLSVIDEGVGIRASDLPHIFRRFYRADTARTQSDRNGYGLGLAIAQQIINRQQAVITVESTLGKGSTFTIKLALAKS